MRLDFPTFDRPAKATSANVGAGSWLTSGVERRKRASRTSMGRRMARPGGRGTSCPDSETSTASRLRANSAQTTGEFRTDAIREVGHLRVEELEVARVDVV